MARNAPWELGWFSVQKLPTTAATTGEETAVKVKWVPCCSADLALSRYAAKTRALPESYTVGDQATAGATYLFGGNALKTNRKTSQPVLRRKLPGPNLPPGLDLGNENLN